MIFRTISVVAAAASLFVLSTASAAADQAAPTAERMHLRIEFLPKGAKVGSARLSGDAAGLSDFWTVDGKLVTMAAYNEREYTSQITDVDDGSQTTQKSTVRDGYAITAKVTKADEAHDVALHLDVSTVDAMVPFTVTEAGKPMKVVVPATSSRSLDVVLKLANGESQVIDMGGDLKARVTLDQMEPKY